MASTENPTHYDLICLGSGEAAKVLAWYYASSQKKRCAVIESHMLGGSCPNVACLPSKNFLYSAKVVHLAGLGEQFGIEGQDLNGVRVSMQRVKAGKARMVDDVVHQHRDEFEKSGAELIWGFGKFVGPKTLEVADRDGGKKILTADVIVVNTGSRARVPDDVPGLVESKPFTHVEALELDELPRHLVILGAGYVGLEFAQAFRRFGSSVTVIDRNARILKQEDEDVSTALRQILENEGVDFRTATQVLSVSGTSGEAVTLRCTNTSTQQDFELHASHILCATGRIPNTQEIALDVAGIRTTPQGHVVVDEQNQTSVQGVYAAGDCTGGPHFTHIGWDDFRILRDVLSGKQSVHLNRRSSRQVPSALFTDPEIAQVGLREQEARIKGIEYRLAKVPMTAFLRTLTMEKGAAAGFAKALISSEDDRILGFTALCPGAGELLPVVQLAMQKRLPYTALAELVFTHPTMNEGLIFLFSGVPQAA